MASADFSLHRAGKVQAQCPASPFQAQSEISQGKARDLRSIHPPHLRPLGLECHRASGLFAPSPTSRTPRMRFVFLGPELCLQLPSRVSSRSCGCCSARGSRHSGPPGDSHPQVTSRSAFASRLPAPVSALRAMPGAQRKRRRPFRAAAFFSSPHGGTPWSWGRRGDQPLLFGLRAELRDILDSKSSIPPHPNPSSVLTPR
jgi:hypothetical protein